MQREKERLEREEREQREREDKERQKQEQGKRERDSTRGGSRGISRRGVATRGTTRATATVRPGNLSFRLPLSQLTCTCYRCHKTRFCEWLTITQAYRVDGKKRNSSRTGNRKDIADATRDGAHVTRHIFLIAH